MGHSLILAKLEPDGTYFSSAAATKEEITSSGTLVAALLFRNVYGTAAERALSVFVALSALGNVLAVVR